MEAYIGAMTESFQEGAIWMVTAALMATGLLGCILPFLPGHLLIFAGALGYWWMMGEKAGIGWRGLAALAGLMIFSQIFEMVSGALGTRWFGGSKWGALGALAGAVAGLFFLPLGLLVGPLAGAFAFEMMFARKDTKPAVVSGVGSMVGTAVGMGFKVVVGVLMVGWFVGDVFWW